MPYNPDDKDAEAASRAERVLQRHEATLLALPGVTGVGLGRDACGDDAIIVYVAHRDVATPKTLESVLVLPEVTGVIEAQDS